jgi:glycerophosphoryl diester phosphodiesterase
MALTILAFSIIAAVTPQLPDGFIIVAHRGGVVNEHLTENSLAALDEAIARGYTHMEVDLRVTKDGHVVCLHDSNLKRTTGVDEMIHNVTLKELYRLVSKDIVPTLDAYCAHANGRAKLMPDLKGGPKALMPAFAKSIEDTLNKYKLMESALFIGKGDLQKIIDIQGRIGIGPKRKPEQVITENPEKAKHLFVFGHGDDFTKENIAKYQALGLQVIVSINTFHYITNEPIPPGMEHIKKMIEWGADGVQIDSVYDPALFEH